MRSTNRSALSDPVGMDLAVLLGSLTRWSKALVLLCIIMLAPWLARWITPSHSVTLDRAIDALPNVGGLLALGACTALASVTVPSLVKKMLSGDRTTAALVAVFLGATGTTLWLAGLFIAGDLGSVSRLFVLTHVIVLGLMLMLVCFLHQTKLLSARRLAVFAGLAITYVALGGGWPHPPAAGDGLWLLSIMQALSAAVGSLVAWPLELFVELSTTLATMLPPTPSQPVSTSLAFVAAALLAHLGTRRLSAGITRFPGRLVNNSLWIVATHFIWLILLFGLGLADVPRWLPLVTATAMAAVTMGRSIVPLLVAGPRGALAELAQGGESHSRDTQVDVGAATKRLADRSDRRAWVISYTGVSNEPRVLRQCEALAGAGWEIVVCGYDGHSARPPEWTYVRLPANTPFNGSQVRYLELLQWAGKRIAAYGWPRAIAEWGGRLSHEATPLWLHTKNELVKLVQSRPDLKPDLVCCHDYHTSGTGYAVARAAGAKLSVDVHEYAAGQYFNDPEWVKWQRPVAIAVQRYYLAKADSITVVCDGIGRLLDKENPLRSSPVTIRGVPFKNAQQFRPVGRRIEVLYHGDLSTRREIHTLIESMRHWHGNIDLRLRGSGDPTYRGDLKRRVAKLGLEKRVFFEGPVPFDQIVPAANKSDIGFFSFRGGSPQIQFTLPNKLFEYVMAGLCLCVGDTDEVGKIVREHQLGKLISPHTPEAIAEAVNSLDAAAIESYKRASIAAADVLNWEVERKRLLAVYDAVAEA